jgi:esterase/lipase
LESSHWALYAEILTEDESKRELVFQKFRESYRRAAPYFSHPAEEISINYSASNLSGYFRLPAAVEADAVQTKLPVVVLLNGLFSAREELHYLENSLLSQGFATLSLDYPGVSQIDAHLPSSFDVNELSNSIYLFLNSRPEIDNTRITLYGLSLGGRIALYMALHNPERFSSIVSMSTPLDLLADIDHVSYAFTREFMTPTMPARTAIYDLALHTQIEESLEYIEAPLLVVGGGKDKIATASDTQTIFDRSMSSDKKLILCPGAGHCLNEMMPSLRYEIAQWIKQRA